MKDTPEPVERIWDRMFQQRTPEERLAMGCSMMGAARQMAEAEIRRRHPEYSEAAVKRDRFLLWYGDAVPARLRDMVLHGLAQGD
jgi:hypothetical protein